MTRQVINTGATANDGTGDTLRVAATKINQNFVELYQAFGSDSNYITTGILFDSTGIIFEGSTVDAYETYLRASNPTAGDVLITMPDSSGVLIVDSAEQTLSNKTLQDPKLIHPDVYDSAGAPYFYAIVPGSAQTMPGKNVNINLPVLSDSDTFVTNTSTSTLTNKTITSPVIDNPIVHGGIRDSAGLELITFTSTGSAVNEIRVTNSATGTGPILTVSGDDTDINLQLTTKGAGTILFNDPQRLASETLTGSGAISVALPLTIINSGAGTAMTLADGTAAGHMKKMLNIGAGAATVTPTNLGNGSTFTLNQYASVDAIWQGSNWYLVGLDSSGGLGNRVIVA